MNFDFPAEDDPRRVEIRQWLEANPHPPCRQLAAQGYTAPNWPPPWGLSAGPELVLILDEELERPGISHPCTRNGIGLNQCGQSLLTWGTDAQCQRFLPPALTCEEKWCTLFSEPAWGSDLGNLRTTARRDGDHYLINGQKIWNSHADRSQIGVTIVRTDSSVPKHKGLSVFLVEMNTPGITVRPIIDMTGEENEYNEVFLDNVRVPASHRLGPEGSGFSGSL
jgi:alkylation response protein AidB-like acyl-CoA dehydrogenase